MNALIVFGVIVVLSAAIGAVSQVLKNVQQAEQGRAARARANVRTGAAARAPANDIDRFLEEIDRLRRKNAGGAESPPVARKAVPPVARRADPADVPTVTPVRKVRLADLPPPPPPQVQPASRPIRGPIALPPAPPPMRLEDLPVAPRLAAGLPVSPPVVTRQPTLVDPRPVAKTDFARQFAALLSSPQAVPMAVVLNEVFGPPKARRG